MRRLFAAETLRREVSAMGPILVAYATKYGSTHEVAEAIATRLRERGLEIEVRAAGTLIHSTATTPSSSAVPSTSSA